MTKRPALRSDVPLDQALAAVVRDILTEARAAILDPAKGIDEAVHDFRKCMKHWRALLRLLAPHVGTEAEDLRSAARDAAKRLGGARDLRSTLDALDNLRGYAHDLTERSLLTVRTRIEEMRAAAETQAMNAADRAAIGDEVARWLATASRWRFAGLQASDLAGSLTEGYRRARRAMPEDWRDASDEELHRFRRRVIDHRYQMESFGPLCTETAAEPVRELQRLRDALGRHRDLALLRALTGPHRPLVRFRAKLAPAIAQRQKKHLAQARRIAGRVFAEKPRAFRARLNGRARTDGGEA